MKMSLIIKVFCYAIMILVMLLTFTAQIVYANQNPAKQVLDNLNALAQNTQNKAPRAILFVSFSLPDNSLKNYILEAKLLGIPIYIRGLYQGSLLKTQQKIARLIKDDQGGMAIDPTQFRQFKITAVPSLVITEDTNHYDRVTGHVSLATLLEEIAKSGEYGNTIAQDLLARISTWPN